MQCLGQFDSLDDLLTPWYFTSVKRLNPYKLGVTIILALRSLRQVDYKINDKLGISKQSCLTKQNKNKTPP